MAHQIDESKPKYLSQTRFMSGRRIIKTSVTEITDENVVDVLRKALATHELNRSEIDYLWKYYRGDQPIRNRVKDVRPEICNKITENAVVVSTAGINENLVLASASGYDPYNSLAQTVYEDSKKSYDGAYSDDSWSRNMREFYHEYVEPTLKEIATDTKRQADKKEQTIVKVGNRTINDAVTTQKEANGFSFTE